MVECCRKLHHFDLPDALDRTVFHKSEWPETISINTFGPAKLPDINNSDINATFSRGVLGTCFDKLSQLRFKRE